MFCFTCSCEFVSRTSGYKWEPLALCVRVTVLRPRLFNWAVILLSEWEQDTTNNENHHHHPHSHDGTYTPHTHVIPGPGEGNLGFSDICRSLIFLWIRPFFVSIGATSGRFISGSCFALLLHDLACSIVHWTSYPGYIDFIVKETCTLEWLYFELFLWIPMYTYP